MLKVQISKDYMTAFKERNVVSKNLLSVIKGEIQTIEKNTGIENLSDDEVIKILNKTAKSLKVVIDISGDKESISQLEIVNSYLPKSMSKEEVTEKVKSLVQSGVNNIGSIMKEFANDVVDRKMLSEVIKENL